MQDLEDIHIYAGSRIPLEFPDGVIEPNTAISLPIESIGETRLSGCALHGTVSTVSASNAAVRFHTLGCRGYVRRKAVPFDAYVVSPAGSSSEVAWLPFTCASNARCRLSGGTVTLFVRTNFELSGLAVRVPIETAALD